MPNVNVCTFIGNLVRDPDSKSLPSGTIVTEFSLAINRTWKNDAGEKQEETSFFDLVAFGKVAEIIAKYCHKGEAHYFGCRARQDTWTDKETEKKRHKVVFAVDDMQLLPNGKRGESAQAPDDDERPA